jgi:hypothetical protein
MCPIQLSYISRTVARSNVVNKNVENLENLEISQLIDAAMQISYRSNATFTDML